MAEPDSTEPKIIVDTDWKEQVAKEKEAASQASSSPSPSELKSELTNEPAPDDDALSEVDSLAPDDVATATMSGDLPPPPTASFEMVVSMFFTQAMAMLGQIPNPATGQPEINKPYAKHYIDTLDVLGEKTRGNLTGEESKMLSEALHALRMMYVNVKQPS